MTKFSGMRGTSSRNARRLALRRKDDTQGGTQTGNEPNQQAGNTGNNQGQPGNQGTGGTNTGSGFDPATFWNSSPDGNSGAPLGGSAANGNQSGGNQQNQQQNAGDEVGQQLTQRLSSLSFAPVFTADIAAQLDEGNMDGVNAAINDRLSHAVRESLNLTAMVLERFGSHLMGQMEAKLNGTLTAKDTETELNQLFPQLVADPGLTPIVKDIYSKALTLCKGDKTQAKAMATDMLKHVGTGVSKGMGLNDPNPSALDGMTSGATSLLESLLGAN